MRIETWLQGCKITVSDWIGKDADGETPIRIGVEYIEPGGAISHPKWEKAIYCPRREEATIKNHLDSIVSAIVYSQIDRRAIKETIYY